METLGIILLSFGAVFCFASSLGLSMSKPQSESLAHQIGDGLSGGLLGFVAGFFRGLRAGIKGPAASEFPLLVLFVGSLALIGGGVVLL